MLIKPSLLSKAFHMFFYVSLFFIGTTLIPSIIDLTGLQVLYWPLFSISMLSLLRCAWIFLELYFTSYEISDVKIFSSKGVLNRRHDNLELFRVKDITIDQPIWLRIFRIATIYLHTSDKSTPILPIIGVKNFKELNDTLRDQVEKSRSIHGVREFD